MTNKATREEFEKAYWDAIKHEYSSIYSGVDCKISVFERDSKGSYTSVGTSGAYIGWQIAALEADNKKLREAVEEVLEMELDQDEDYISYELVEMLKDALTTTPNEVKDK